MEIRNALIVLTKISSVFPVTRKSGINIEKRVAKIKGDEREDLKVLATGVAAALAARKSSWVSEEEFGMGYLDIKPLTASSELSGNWGNAPNGSALTASQGGEKTAGRNPSSGNHIADPSGSSKDQISRAKSSDGRADRSDGLAPHKPRGGSLANGLDAPLLNLPPGVTKSSGVMKNTDEATKLSSEELAAKVALKAAVESETRSLPKRSVQNPVGKQIKQELVKDDAKAGKSINRTTSHPAAMSDRDFPAHLSEGRQGGNAVTSLATTNGSTVSKVSTSSARMVADMHGKMDSGAMRTSDDFVEGHETSRTISARPNHSSFLDDSFTKQQKRTAVEEQDKVNKHRKGDSER